MMVVELAGLSSVLQQEKQPLAPAQIAAAFEEEPVCSSSPFMP